MSKHKRIETEIEGLYVIEHQIFGDSRGFFTECYHKKDFQALGMTKEFVQDNHSKSSKGVLRGLHFQIKHPQAKLVRVIAGEVFDVGVDIRPGSPTYLKWCGIHLRGEDNRLLYIPEGCAHGFLVLSDVAELQYKCTDFYNPSDEGGIIWNDETINIQWPLGGIEQIFLSEKDKNLKRVLEGAIS